MTGRIRIGVVLLCVFPAALLAEESLTITTYYPSPQGSYQRLQSKAMGIGDVNKDGLFNMNDVPDPGTYPGQLVVANRLGVGVGTVLAQPVFVAGNSTNHTAVFVNNITGVGLALGAINHTLTSAASVQANSFDIATQTNTGVLNLSLNPYGGNVGINTVTPAYKLDVKSNPLGSSAGDRSLALNVYTNVGVNSHSLQLFTQRSSAGTDWYTTEMYLRKKIDATDMGFVKWPANSQSIEFGNGTKTNFRVCSDGNVMGSFFCCGHTDTGGSGWSDYSTNGAVITVDTSGCGFTSAPMYFSSIGGGSAHWGVTGADAIYNPTSTSFQVYVRGTVEPINAVYASSRQWHIQWCGIKLKTGGVDKGSYSN